MTPQQQAEALIIKWMPFHNSYLGMAFEILECSKVYALMEINGIEQALSEYDNNLERYIIDEFGKEYYSAQVQNMDGDFRYWTKVKKCVEEISELPISKN